MKFKPEKGGGVLVELSPKDKQLPTPEPVGTLSEFRLKKILVPVDFSKCSRKALQYAIPFAKQFEAELTLLYVIPYPSAVPEMMVSYAEVTDESLKALDELVRDIHGAVPCKTLLKEGSAALEIVNAAVESGSDLIILSTHGRSGLAHVLLGSTTERVVRYAPCPVLVVRQREREFVESGALDRILV